MSIRAKTNEIETQRSATMNNSQYQQWFNQRAARNQPVQIQQDREWIFYFSAIDQSGDPVSYQVRMGGNSYGRTFTQACRRFYVNFPGSQIQSATSVNA